MVKVTGVRTYAIESISEIESDELSTANPIGMREKKFGQLEEFSGERNTLSSIQRCGQLGCSTKMDRLDRCHSLEPSLPVSDTITFVLCLLHNSTLPSSDILFRSKRPATQCIKTPLFVNSNPVRSFSAYADANRNSTKDLSIFKNDHPAQKASRRRPTEARRQGSKVGVLRKRSFPTAVLARRGGANQRANWSEAPP
ncbi:hypothetical protein EVAR_96302_1 [Eumeta japonica]|uniref:Uncharacterized protein n=1 Tax=Eumeta variegata TaxID=151549 RepID=A0A4C1VYN1_EUMVA|nr:hypothetical protein EVAR_96302_1 [Eumeta japonica]